MRSDLFVVVILFELVVGICLFCVYFFLKKVLYSFRYAFVFFFFVCL